METNDKDWSEEAAPVIKPEEVVEEPEMSEVATLGNIFIEPGRTFEDLRRKPRFIIGGILVVLMISAFGFALNMKAGEDGQRRFAEEQIDKSPNAENMSAEQKKGAVELSLTIQKVIGFVMPVFVIIALLIGSLFYWIGAKIFGGTGGFGHALSIWVYSAFPVTVVMTIANFLILFLKSAEDIDLGTAQRGLVQANLSFLVDGKAMPVVATILSVIDIFAIWGWFLTSIGLQKTNKLSSASAWAITLGIAGVGILFRIVSAIASGNPS